MQNLKGILPDKAVQVITAMQNQFTALKTDFTALAAKPLLTKPQADKAYGSAAQAQALAVNGSNPLNVTGLLGISPLPPGVYTLGAKLTGDGQNGTITIGTGGQIIAIQQAT